MGTQPLLQGTAGERGHSSQRRAWGAGSKVGLRLRELEENPASSSGRRGHLVQPRPWAWLTWPDLPRHCPSPPLPSTDSTQRAASGRQHGLMALEQVGPP